MHFSAIQKYDYKNNLANMFSSAPQISVYFGALSFSMCND